VAEVIDLAIVFHAAVSGFLIWRAQKESRFWDRFGFVLLGCSVGFMSWRHATSRFDIYLKSSDLLTTIILILMVASGACFTIEMAVRMIRSRSDITTQTIRANNYIRPFGLVFLCALLDALPAQDRQLSVAQGERRQSIILERDLSRNCDELYQEMLIDINTLQLLANSDSPYAAVAKKKLQLIVQQIDIKLDIHPKEVRK
jgi:hypothetical protein